MIIGGPRGLPESPDNIYVASFGPNFDDSVTTICTCDKDLAYFLPSYCILIEIICTFLCLFSLFSIK